MTSPDDEPPRALLSDPELITAVRAGDPDAYGTLYTRHVEAARRLALALASHPSDADDLVAEAFAKLLSTLREGGGPNVAFRAYLLTTVRNLFYDRTRREQRVRVTDDLSRHDTGEPFVDTAVEGLERSLVARAFARLPERWQTVLWHTEVEGESPASVAPMLDLTPNGVAALAYRARERLRQNYLREHVTTSPTDECRSTIDRLGGYVRSGLSARDRSAVDAHLSGCRRCQVLYLELGDVNAGLRGVLAPVVLGEVAVAAYLGSASASGVTALISPIWSSTKRIARRRSTQAGAAGAVAAAVALAMVLTSSPTREDPPAGPEQPPAAAGPEGPPPADPPVAEPTPEAADPEPVAEPPGVEDPTVPEPPPDPDDVEPVPLDVSLEPVGALVRDRPGVLVLTVAAAEPGGSGGELSTVPMQASPDTGPLTAEVTVPDGVQLRADEPGDGWGCTDAGDGFRCQRDSLAAGGTTQAYLPVAVAVSAASGAPTVRLTGPGIEATSATATRGVAADGLAARFAGIMPATVVIGGNSLLSCPDLDLTCGRARVGKEAFGRADNDHYLMAKYTEPHPPAGAPRRAAVSAATIRVPGPVVWAALFWAGSGEAPGSPTAYLHAPGDSGYATVEATAVRRAGSGYGRSAYQASAEVTDLVRGSPGGDWWVAVDAGAFSPRRAAFGGWALVLVAEDGGADRSVAVFDELTLLREEQSFSAAVYGFPGSAQVGYVGWEGDRGLAGDRLRLGGATLGGAGQDNVAASRADGTPSGWHTFGTDARVLDASVSGAGDPPTLTAVTGSDAWLLGPVVVITPPPP